MLGRRIDRIEEQLRIELSEIIEREIQDPRIGLTTVTRARASTSPSTFRSATAPPPTTRQGRVERSSITG